MKNKIDIFKASKFCAPRYFPFEYFYELSQWEYIHKSPYSVSFYSDKVNWGIKPDKCLRISDHWNFTSRLTLHCKTDIPVPENHWAIGQYNAEQGIFIILDIKNPKIKLASDKDFRLLLVNLRYDSLIKNGEIAPELQERIDYSYMKKYFKIQES